jgi:hypothetical protein
MSDEEVDAAFLISRHIRFIFSSELMVYVASGTRGKDR